MTTSSGDRHRELHHARPRGLNAGNVGDAIRAVRPYGVDLCTGIRTDGRLDDEKLRAFMRAVRDAA